MAISIGSSLSSVATSLSFPSHSRNSKPHLLEGWCEGHRCGLQQMRCTKGKSHQFLHLTWRGRGLYPKKQLTVLATSEDQSSYNEFELDPSEQVNGEAESISTKSSLPLQFEGNKGKPGFISFYGHPYVSPEEILVSSPIKERSNLLWFVGPTVLVSSFIFPSLYLRKILSAVFEDSLLTDFLILFFTEALFYCGVGVFLFLIDHLQRPLESISFPKSYGWQTNQLGHRISSVAVLVLSLIIPMVTMGFVWPWTGPAASATLAPYLVGIVVQFAFEQYVRYLKSPSWFFVPIVFQVYRLHQLNRAAQLVTALSFTVRGAETTSHTLAINNSLGTLLNVLHFLGVICIWSLSSFLMRFIPSSAAIPEK